MKIKTVLSFANFLVILKLEDLERHAVYSSSEKHFNNVRLVLYSTPVRF